MSLTALPTISTCNDIDDDELIDVGLGTTATVMPELALPELYTLQRAIIDHPAKYKVIACGRQVGKTMLCALDSRKRLIAGQRKLYTSTSQKQTDQFWEYIKAFTADLNPYKHDSRRIMRLGEGLLDVQTASAPDSLRSGHYHHIDFDECAYLDPRVWSQVGIPMLLRYDGSASFWSTPKRRNWFFLHFQKAQQKQADGERWAVWNFATTENPHLSTAALTELTENMTEEDYQQEILAQFLEGQGAVFRYVTDRATLQRCEPYKSRFVFGIDQGQAKDYFVILVMDASIKAVVDYDRFHGVDWTVARDRVKTMYQRWHPETMIMESNMGETDPNIEFLQREGLPVRAFHTTASSKPPLIESLVLAFDRGEIAILGDPIMTGELMAYERTITASGRSQYSAPQGMHDDCVIALALAWHGAQFSSTFEVIFA